ncbi:hypothetical protein [Nocardiopsis alba]|uniref:hypothetical protein n=1 Tax=Nocardiopsis alba TaxID=53437 RepID=UPI0033BA9C57
MSWMAPVQARDQSIIPAGMDVRVSDPEMPQMRQGRWPSLMVHRGWEDVPDLGIVPAPESTAGDLEHLAEMARVWAERLEDAARVRRDQEDSQAYQDAG